MQNNTLITVSIQLEALKNRLEKGNVIAADIAADLHNVENQINEIKQVCFCQLGIQNGTFEKYELQKLLESVADAFSYEPEDIKSVSRKSDLVLARSVFARLARKIGYKYEEIAEAMNRTNHTSAMNLVSDNAFRVRLNKIPRKDVYIETIQRLERQIFKSS